jgi:phosphatidate cytidylyltransferase
MSDWADPHADDLRARIVSGIVLGGAAVFAAIAGGPWLAGACAAAATAMSFEWARMAERSTVTLGFALNLAASLGAIMAASWGKMEVALLWATAFAVISGLRRGFSTRGLETGFGALYIGAPCAALVWLRSGAEGLNVVLALFFLVWSADVAAYFGGRAFGGPRVAPSLSPRKTWSGMVSGALAAAGAGAGFADSINAPIATWAVVGACLGAIGLGGDLFESAAKRRFGVKDASGLIPGHGGVLDRVDGLLAATAAAAVAAVSAPRFFSVLFPEQAG